MLFPRSTNPMRPSKTKKCLYCGAEYIPRPSQKGTYGGYFDGFCVRLHELYGWGFVPDPAKKGINRDDLERHGL